MACYLVVMILCLVFYFLVAVLTPISTLQYFITTRRKELFLLYKILVKQTLQNRFFKDCRNNSFVLGGCPGAASEYRPTGLELFFGQENSSQFRLEHCFALHYSCSKKYHNFQGRGIGRSSGTCTRSPCTLNCYEPSTFACVLALWCRWHHQTEMLNCCKWCCL